MDADRFDTLSRALSSAPSRRGLLAALVSGLLAIAAAGDDAAADRSGRCKPRCGQCEKCKKGDCQKKNGKKRCKRGKCKPRANGFACGSSQVCCDGACVDFNTDPRNCGSCGKRCQLNATCNAGACACVNGDCTIFPGFSCCPPTRATVRCQCHRTGGVSFADPTTCSDSGFLNECPAGSTPCVGPECQACCPSGSTCDTSTGTCLQ